MRPIAITGSFSFILYELPSTATCISASEAALIESFCTDNNETLLYESLPISFASPYAPPLNPALTAVS